MSAEALVLVVDVGASLVNSQGHLRIVQALEAVRLVLRSKLQSPRARDVLGVVLFGTHETRNERTEQSGAFDNIFVAYDIGKPCASVLRFLSPSWSLLGLVKTEGEGDEAKKALLAAERMDAERLQLAACGAERGDFLCALSVALDMLAMRTGTKKSIQRRIFLVSDLCCRTDSSRVDDVITKLRNSDSRLNVIDIGSDSDSVCTDGLSTEARMAAVERTANLSLVDRITGGLNAAAIIPVQEAFDLLTDRKPRSVLLRTCFRGAFEVSPLLKIGVYSYVKSRVQSFPTLKKITDTPVQAASGAAAAAGGVDSDGEENDDDAAPPPPSDKVQMARSLHPVDDPDAEVAPDEAIKAYRYGKSYVPFTKIDEAALKQETERCLTLLGFTKADSVPRHHFLTGADMIVADPTDIHAQRAFSAIVTAMAETDSYAICRYVSHKNAPPVITVLIPHPRAENDCCWAIQLPFAEDIRYYEFTPLLRSDKRSRKQFQPTDEQRAAARNLIESMSLVQTVSRKHEPDLLSDLSGIGGTEGTDEEEEQIIEFLAPKKTYNPVIRRFYDAVNVKTIVPDIAVVSAPTGCDDLVTPEIVRKRARTALSEFKKAFPLERVVTEKVDTKQYWREKLLAATASVTPGSSGPSTDKDSKTVVLFSGQPDSTASGMKIPQTSGSKGKVALDDLLARGVDSVGSMRPAKDFEAMLARRDKDLVIPAIEQLRGRIEQFVRDSIGDQYFAKAVDALAALRRGCVTEDEPDLFNEFLLNLQRMCSDDEALTKDENNDKKRFWKMVAEAAITPISKDESAFSNVSKEDAARFHSQPVASQPQPQQLPPPPPLHDEAMDDLFNMAD